MRRVFIAASVMMVLVICTFTSASGAQTSSPYVVGEWALADIFTDTSGTSVTTADSQFIFVNPTNHQQFIEYAFFATDGTFCGCDRDVENANARTRYTMSGEAQGGQFVCTGSVSGSPKATEGTLKAIVFTVKHSGSINFEDSSTAGNQIHFEVGYHGGTPNNTESELSAVPLTNSVVAEIQGIHKQCVSFCNANPAINCPALTP